MHRVCRRRGQARFVYMDNLLAPKGKRLNMIGGSVRKAFWKRGCPRCPRLPGHFYIASFLHIRSCRRAFFPAEAAETMMNCYGDLFYGRPDLQPLICGQMGNQRICVYIYLEISGTVEIGFLRPRACLLALESISDTQKAQICSQHCLLCSQQWTVL